MFNSFVGLYNLSKTLRFELRPIGKTLDYIKKNGFLDQDDKRAKEYTRIKDIIDAQHKALLERVLSQVADVDWEDVASAYDEFHKSDKSKVARDKLEAYLAQVRKTLVNHFKQDDKFKDLTEATPSKLLKALVKEAEDRGQNPEDALKVFNRFACYFTGFQTNRKNIYSPEAQTTAAAYRAVNVNFSKFLDCCQIFRHLNKTYPQVIEDAEKTLGNLLKGRKLEDVFSPAHYSKFLSQSGIDDFNTVIGGYFSQQEQKIQGLNEHINLLKQQDETARNDRAISKMPALYKQILSDRETISFVAEQFENDGMVLKAIRAFGEMLQRDETIEKLKACVGKLLGTEEAVFIDGEHLPDVSSALCGRWSVLGDLLHDLAKRKFLKDDAKQTTKLVQAMDKWCKRSEIPLSDITESLTLAIDLKDEQGNAITNVADSWRNKVALEKFTAVTGKFNALQKVFDTPVETGLREREADVACIKDYLDALQDVMHLLKPLYVSEQCARDISFYGEFDANYTALCDALIPLYNRVRNYLTQKPSEVKKMKLMFNTPTLADGWDLNKEAQNHAILLERQGRYYLGVMNPSKASKLKFEHEQDAEASSCYHKMEYKLLPDPSKMLPKCLLTSQTAKEAYQPTSGLLANYDAKKHTKGDTFDLAFCHELINYFKHAISHYPNWRIFNFKFSPTCSYQDISDFYREVSEQGYKLSFITLSEKTVDTLVENGDLYLFMLYNKDFAPGATGRPNLHTLYWRMLFNLENLKNLVFKLNGGAELFYRRASIAKPFVHHVGEKMVNRRDRTGKPIPAAVFGELFRYANGKLSLAELSVPAKALVENDLLVVKDVRHSITKDARYTQDKFFFHVPITINVNAPDKPSKFNDRVNARIRESSDVNVIGIDRGERHLLYVTVVNAKGKILEQRSFNTLGHEVYGGRHTEIDYHAKLDQVERERAEARRSWKTIGKITDLKEGYLSVVVNEIAHLMVKYNAIVVLEDLNFGFKRGRFAIEKQVYQKFEKALIDKLNYLVFKDRDVAQPGGVLQGFQLTDKFESFSKLGKQTGFLYYVPAAYTSKIDPTTGFTNLFDFKHCTNDAARRQFFTAFEAITYSAAENSFAFSFDYNNFKTHLKGMRTKWVVYSANRRIVYDTQAKCEKDIYPTEIIRGALEKRGVILQDGFDVKAWLLSQETNQQNTDLFKTIFYAFERTLQLRNSNAKTGEDYIHSPVKNVQGGFFDSRQCDDALPKNADANGAYHIALKGLWIVLKALHQDKPKLALEHETWLAFAQSRNP